MNKFVFFAFSFRVWHTDCLVGDLIGKHVAIQDLHLFPLNLGGVHRSGLFHMVPLGLVKLCRTMCQLVLGVILVVLIIEGSHIARDDQYVLHQGVRHTYAISKSSSTNHTTTTSGIVSL